MNAKEKAIEYARNYGYSERMPRFVKTLDIAIKEAKQEFYDDIKKDIEGMKTRFPEEACTADVFMQDIKKKHGVK